MELFGFDLNGLEFWHWFSLGGVFFVLEILSLSFFFLWLGASAVFVGLIMVLMPTISWQLQWGIWAATSVIGVVIWRVYRTKNPKQHTSDEPNLNKRGDQYIDRVFTLEEPIINGFGKVKVDDSIWKVECETDLDIGTKVKVVDIEGTVLQVVAE